MVDRSLTEYMKILAYARHMNIRVIKYHGLEVEFLPKLPISPDLDGATLGDEAMPTEDQLLYWSSGHEIDYAAKPPTE
jgi:hypothetical protein